MQPLTFSGILPYKSPKKNYINTARLSVNTLYKLFKTRNIAKSRPETTAIFRIFARYALNTSQKYGHSAYIL
ncbi:MAG: hypothetical protein EAY75_00300 [Bacteroidetes bacterium]|nr:MAG: hypothetical protein EAY75_00300 [Bacteroidota bacterium]